jgi:hypothetical protein
MRIEIKVVITEATVNNKKKDRLYINQEKQGDYNNLEDLIDDIGNKLNNVIKQKHDKSNS